MHSVNVGLSCSGVCFFEHFNYTVFFLQNRKTCLGKNIFLPKLFLVFSPVWDSFSSENNLISLHNTKKLKEKTTPGFLN